MILKKKSIKKERNKLWTRFEAIIQSWAAKVLHSKTLHVPWPVWLQSRDIGHGNSQTAVAANVMGWTLKVTEFRDLSSFTLESFL